MIDCSKKGYCGTMIVKRTPLVLETDMVINIAKTVLFAVNNISFDDNSNNPRLNADFIQTYHYTVQNLLINSKLILKCLEGPYVDQCFLRSSETATVHLVGRGGGGVAPDIYIPAEYGVSRKHLELRFENGYWLLIDEESVNGTFLLIKNFNQIATQQISRPVELFSQITTQDKATILLSKYTLFI